MKHENNLIMNKKQKVKYQTTRKKQGEKYKCCEVKKLNALNAISELKTSSPCNLNIKIKYDQT